MHTNARLGALAGIVAPLVLAIVVGALTIHQRQFLAKAGWDAVRRTRVGWPSVLAFGSGGWLETVAFAAVGALGLIFAAALYEAVPTRAAKVGAAAIGLLALVLAVEALHGDPPWSAQRTWHGRVHDGVYPLVLVSAVTASLTLAVGLWRNARWRWQGRLALGAAVVLALSLLVQINDAVGQLGEYLFFGPLLVWLELLALGLWRRPDDGRREQSS